MSFVYKELNQYKNIKQNKEVQNFLEHITMPQYGFITIVIHDGKVVQIEKNEKYRL